MMDVQSRLHTEVSDVVSEDQRSCELSSAGVRPEHSDIQPQLVANLARNGNQILMPPSLDAEASLVIDLDCGCGHPEWPRLV